MIPSATVRVAQGIGDIFWTYQKLAPHVGSIHYQILARDPDSELSRRAVPWVKLLPQVAGVEVVKAHQSEIATLFGSRRSMDEVLADVRESTDYCVNRHLESGTRIEAIDPQYAIAQDVPLPVIAPPIGGDYLCLYVSGDTLNPHMPHRVWSLEQWRTFLVGFRHQCDLPIVLIGAEYDRQVAAQLAAMLGMDGFAVTTLIGHEPAKVLGVLKHCKLFLGYQSGLSVLADNLDVPQIMFYFPHLRPMLYTWCKRQNAGTLYRATTFDIDPSELASAEHQALPIT